MMMVGSERRDGMGGREIEIKRRGSRKAAAEEREKEKRAACCESSSTTSGQFACARLVGPWPSPAGWKVRDGSVGALLSHFPMAFRHRSRSRLIRRGRGGGEEGGRSNCCQPASPFFGRVWHVTASHGDRNQRVCHPIPAVPVAPSGQELWSLSGA